MTPQPQDLLLLHQLARHLTQRDQRLMTAESCTGGLVSAWCTALPGSSAWFEAGLATYSNAAKTRLLGVPEALLAVHGAVSEPVVLAMVAGAQAALAPDAPSTAVPPWALALSGVAGPGGGTAAKPVGLVCFAWARPDGVAQADTVRFEGDRDGIRLQATRHALDGLLQRLTA